MAGNAVKEAAWKLRQQLFAAASEKLGVPADRLVAAFRRISDRDDPEKFLTFVDAANLAEARHGTLVAAGSYTPPKGIGGTYKGAGVGPSPAYSFQACVAEVTVDTETGVLTVDKLSLAHDCGRAINPANVEGQIEGAAYMGYGEAVVEEQVFRGGLHKKPSLLEYKLPTSLDTPELKALIIETIDAEGLRREGGGRGPAQPGDPRDRERGLRRDRRADRRDADHAGRSSTRSAARQPRPEGTASGRPASATEGRPSARSAPRRDDRRPRRRAEGRERAAPQSGRRRGVRSSPRFTLVEARTARGRDARRGDERAMLVAGGTDLFPNMKRRQATPSTLVSLAKVPGLAGIRNGTDLRSRAHDARDRRRRRGARRLRRARDRRRARLDAAASEHGHARRQPLPRHPVQRYDQSAFWRAAEGYCMKTNAGSSAASRVEPPLPRGRERRHGPRAPRPRREGSDHRRARRARGRPRRALPRGRHPLLTLAPREVVTEIVSRPRTAGAPRT